MDTMRILTAILLPPFATFKERGFDGTFWCTLLLTGLGFFPGIIHALWVMADAEDDATNRGADRNLWLAGS